MTVLMIKGGETRVNRWKYLPSATTLVERADVLAELGELWQRARTGHGRIVFISGEAGIGKTALLTAFGVGTEDALIRCGGCDNLLTPEPLGPLIEALPELADALEELSGPARLRALSTALGSTSDDPYDRRPALG